MRFSTLTCVALAAATLRPVVCSNVETNTPTVDKSILVQATLPAATSGEYMVSGVLKSLLDFSAIARRLWDLLHFAHAGEFFWDKVTELGPKFQGHTDGLFHYAMELYPSDTITEFKASVGNVTSTATTLHQVISEAAEQHGIPLDSMKGELGDIFNSMFEELKEQFPPPDEAPSHENRMAMITTALDRIEGGFLQFAINHGVSEEPLKSHSNSLKLHAQSIVVTIGTLPIFCGDLVEQHPDLAITLLVAAITVLLPELWLLRQVLRMFGFGPGGPVKGGVAAWLQRWLFGPAVPKGGWFATLQHLAMKAVKL
ncbi:hypothetical protein AZE42_12356 [Rhizopogon vesiculosus]|uniref:Uncharacterized protein n=1 Tax=Rhizopogon vesiculosus TaxID=180088 RepID=A0A1J8Q9R3_9AGAM|nr:hypothetical protein AZE42_12356 [Rhizopogon vesiculosus]